MILVHIIWMQHFIDLMVTKAIIWQIYIINHVLTATYIHSYSFSIHNCAIIFITDRHNSKILWALQVFMSASWLFESSLPLSNANNSLVNSWFNVYMIRKWRITDWICFSLALHDIIIANCLQCYGWPNLFKCTFK